MKAATFGTKKIARCPMRAKEKNLGSYRDYAEISKETPISTSSAAVTISAIRTAFAAASSYKQRKLKTIRIMFQLTVSINGTGFIYDICTQMVTIS